MDIFCKENTLFASLGDKSLPEKGKEFAARGENSSTRLRREAKVKLAALLPVKI